MDRPRIGRVADVVQLRDAVGVVGAAAAARARGVVREERALRVGHALLFGAVGEVVVVDADVRALHGLAGVLAEGLRVRARRVARAGAVRRSVLLTLSPGAWERAYVRAWAQAADAKQGYVQP